LLCDSGGGFPKKEYKKVDEQKKYTLWRGNSGMSSLLARCPLGMASCNTMMVVVARGFLNNQNALQKWHCSRLGKLHSFAPTIGSTHTERERERERERFVCVCCIVALLHFVLCLGFLFPHSLEAVSGSKSGTSGVPGPVSNPSSVAVAYAELICCSNATSCGGP